MLGFDINLQNQYLILCKLYLYTSFVFITLSPSVLILASIDRLLISSQNVDTRLYSSKRLAYFSISTSTCFWTIFNIHALIGGSIQEIYPSYYECSFNTSKFYFYFVTYFYGISNVLVCILMILLCSLSLKNVRQIRSCSVRDKRKQIRSMTKKDFQLLRCLFVQDIVYICFSMSLIIFYIYQTSTMNRIETIFEQTLINFLQKFFLGLFSLYYSTVFFVFLFVSKAFRHEFKRMIYKSIGKNLMSMREEDHRQEDMERNKPEPELNVVSTIELRY